MSSVRACVVVAAGCASAEHLALCSSQFSPLPPAFLLHKSLILGAVKPLMLGAVSSDPPCGKAGLCRCFLAACWSSCAPHLGVSSRGGTWCEGMSQVLAGHPLAANQFSPAWDVLCQSWGGKGAGAGGGGGEGGRKPCTCWMSVCLAAALYRAEGQTAGEGKNGQKRNCHFFIAPCCFTCISSRCNRRYQKVGLCPKCALTRGVLLPEGEAQDAGCSPGAPQRPRNAGESSWLGFRLGLPLAGPILLC